MWHQIGSARENPLDYTDRPCSDSNLSNEWNLSSRLSRISLISFASTKKPDVQVSLVMCSIRQRKRDGKVWEGNGMFGLMSERKERRIIRPISFPCGRFNFNFKIKGVLGCKLEINFETH